MRFVFLISLFLSGCFFPQVQDLHDQIEETYFGNDFIDPPTPLKDLESNVSVKLKVIWEENIGEHNGNNLDIFYVDDFLYAASSDGTIKKLDVNTGNKLWEKNHEITITSGISGDSENLFFSTIDGFLWCMNHNGELIWKTLLEGEINSLPIVYDEKIVVKLNSYKIIQLDTKDGSVIWKYQAAIPPLTFKSEGKLVQSNKVVYLGLPGGKLIAIDSPTGGLVWEANISRSRGATDIERANDITSHPIIDGPVIFGVTTNGDISSLDRRTGKTIWTQPLSSFYGMTFDGFNLFVTHDTGSIYSVNKGDGEVKWHQAALKYRRVGAGALIKDYIIFGDYEGYVHLLNINDGVILGRLKLEDSQILNNIIKLNDESFALMTAAGDLISIKIGEKVINEKLQSINDDSSISEDDSEKEIVKTNNERKHRIFKDKDKDKDKDNFKKEKESDNEVKKQNNLKKHRVFDDDEDEEEGVLDKLFQIWD